MPLLAPLFLSRKPRDFHTQGNAREEKKLRNTLSSPQDSTLVARSIRYRIIIRPCHYVTWLRLTDPLHFRSNSTREYKLRFPSTNTFLSWDIFPFFLLFFFWDERRRDTRNKFGNAYDMILVQIYLFSLRYSQSSKFTIYILESITESVHIYKYGCTIRREWLFHIEKNLKSLWWWRQSVMLSRYIYTENFSQRQTGG